MKAAGLIAGALALAACHSAPEDQPDRNVVANEPLAENASASKADCEQQRFEGTTFTHCPADPETQTVAMRLKGQAETPLRSLTALALEPDSGSIAFAMNGGMYDEEGMPIGYYVEKGELLHDVSEADGPGNFHMKPNGIFFGTDGKWQVLTTEAFVSNEDTRPQFATQSGPMLLIDGKLHPDFAEDGESKNIRNAVGVDEDGRAHFVISDQPVSFGKLARFMRDILKTPNALYLDGNISALWDPGAGRIDTTTGLGPLIVVENKNPGADRKGDEK